ncbi:MAG: aminotransferase class V-fold PLP-dependent enzyme [Bacillota bacterium]|nr:aminotransferase class V-fold PLP-dependent enzyme [Bacillota bacterium]
MIYLDNAATTFPKPKEVMAAMQTAMCRYSANPGRSGHKLSLKAASEIYRCRETVADFFNVKNVENIIFTSNCTHSLNIVMKGYLKKGDHVVVSCLEHNSVMRPLHELSKIGVTFTEAQVYMGDHKKTVESFNNAINKKTKLVICTHASNVWGIRLPIEEIAKLCKERKIKFMVDAAQSAGVLPIDFENMGIDFLCMPGHKSLFGPMGTGILILSDSSLIDPLMTGGTGSSSFFYEQPNQLPDKFESGTPNLPGIVGLRAGIQYIQRIHRETIHEHEMKLIYNLYSRLSNMRKVKLYTGKPVKEYYVPVLSFNINNFDSESAAEILNSQYNIGLRAGLHCSPSAHKFMETEETGSLRVSPSFFSSMQHIDALVKSIEKIQ